MKPIEARNQVRLGLGRCAQLAVSGMAYRLFRSLMTLSILTLAVAFLMHIVAYGLMAHETEHDAYTQLRQIRTLGERMTRLATADSPAVIQRRLGEEPASRLEQYRQWSQLEEQAFVRHRAIARDQQRVLRWLADLEPVQRVVLAGDRDGLAWLDHLQDSAAWQRFTDRLETQQLTPPLAGLDALAELVRQRRPELLDTVTAIRQGHEAAVTALREAYPDRSVQSLLADPPDDLQEQVAAAGFELEEDDLPALQRFAARAVRTERLIDLLDEPDVRRRGARELNVMPEEVDFDQTLRLLARGRDADWLADAIAPIEPGWSGEALVELAVSHERERRLSEVVGDEPVRAREGLFDLPPRTLWLIGLSFLVCVVGVSNAMLMSVTERFTEIATMKCLGAMDGFVMMMFVIEAAIYGIIGGLIGVTIGAVLAVLRGLTEYGLLIGAATVVANDVTLAMVLAMGTGVALAVLAAIGPSWVAAYLPPMEAMRVE